MSRTTIPGAGNIICQHGSHVLLIRRSARVDSWPNYWAFPGGKIEDNELLRECALRECEEEIGITADPRAIQSETVVMTRTIQGTKVVYFWLLENWHGTPEILEPHLITDLAWFPISELPEPMIPHHRIGLEAILGDVGYTEFDIAP